jgi:hypothetical protein
MEAALVECARLLGARVLQVFQFDSSEFVFVRLLEYKLGSGVERNPVYYTADTTAMMEALQHGHAVRSWEYGVDAFRDWRELRSSSSVSSIVTGPLVAVGGERTPNLVYTVASDWEGMHVALQTLGMLL